MKGDESGATAIEYGLIAALISVAIIAGASSIGSKLGDTFSHISTCMGSSTGNDTCTAASGGDSGGADANGANTGASNNSAVTGRTVSGTL
ncbi:Flp family type IVb pilin [Pararhizobium mangrovi]|uniref:Flp family type IVb pilin n=1 Tax=Pararhizobium mangrovi TaxID=2590452 RepID=A0A506U3L8_9HYPH|nr:Flp family type IVb pilin [Pararhizobium mangrovi]